MSDPDPPSPTGPEAPPPCEIQLQNPGRYREVGARRLRPWLEAVVAELAPAAESLAVRFVTDREMRRLNATWRQKDQSTDVLSFPGALRGLPGVAEAPDGEAPEGAGPFDGHHLGDIAISIPTARRQAQHRGHRVEQELQTLLLHGLLHCLGFDHETDGGTMERLEYQLRTRWIDHV